MYSLPSLSWVQGERTACLGTSRAGRGEISPAIPEGTGTVPLLPESESEGNAPFGVA